MAEEKKKGFFAGLWDKLKKEPETQEKEVTEKVSEPEKVKEETGELKEKPIIEEPAEEKIEKNAPPAEEEKKGFLSSFKPTQWIKKLTRGLEKTRKSFVFKITGLFKLRNVIDEDFWEDLEDILITADVGIETTTFIVEDMQRKVEEQYISDPSQLLEVLREELEKILGQKKQGLNLNPEGLSVIMVVGVNGTGKTTSIAKMANLLMQEDRKVLIAAADTFRAAAIEQLEVWGKKIGLDIIKHKEGADPAAVVFDAVSAAKARDVDVLIIDTAGRLHSKVNLMKELEKIKKVIRKNIPDAPHETLLVLDSTTGQNALIQAKTFSRTVDITGIVLTKLDGTAKGGIIIGIGHELDIPVKYIGIGEGVYDLRPFEASYFLDALFSEEKIQEKETLE
ncbi:MAG: signal recognition particle-docking protein FtsY [Vulcanimicrobiota bacterium]